METTKHKAHFTDLVTFIDCRVKIFSDLLFGNIQHSLSGVRGTKTLARFKSQPINREKENAVITITSMELPEEDKRPISGLGKAEEAGCLCCVCNHSLENCQHLKGKKHREKISFLWEKRVCFACLCTGHISRNCKRRTILCFSSKDEQYLRND